MSLAHITKMRSHARRYTKKKYDHHLLTICRIVNEKKRNGLLETIWLLEKYFDSQTGAILLTMMCGMEWVRCALVQLGNATGILYICDFYR